MYRILTGGIPPKPFGALYGARIRFLNNNLAWGGTSFKIVNSTFPLLTQYLLDPTFGKTCINGGADLRCSLDINNTIGLVGGVRGVYIRKCVVDANPANQELEIVLNGLPLNPTIFLWWGIPGATPLSNTLQRGVFGRDGDPTLYGIVLLGNDLTTSTVVNSPANNIAVATTASKSAINEPIESTGPITPMRSQDFSVADCYITVPYTAALYAAFTFPTYVIQFWMQYVDSVVTGNQVIFSTKSASSDTYGISVELINGVSNQIRVYTNDGTAQTITLPFNLTANDWHQYTIVYYNSAGTDSILIFYVDSVVLAFITINDGPFVYGTDNPTLGNNTAFTGPRLMAKLSHFMFSTLFINIAGFNGSALKETEFVNTPDYWPIDFLF